MIVTFSLLVSLRPEVSSVYWNRLGESLPFTPPPPLPHTTVHVVLRDSSDGRGTFITDRCWSTEGVKGDSRVALGQ